jgi:hypothetical protein
MIPDTANLQGHRCDLTSMTIHLMVHTMFGTYRKGAGCRNVLAIVAIPLLGLPYQTESLLSTNLSRTPSPCTLPAVSPFG